MTSELAGMSESERRGLSDEPRARLSSGWRTAPHSMVVGLDAEECLLHDYRFTRGTGSALGSHTDARSIKISCCCPMSLSTDLRY